MIADIGSTPYRIVLVLHVFLVVVGFGGLFLAPMLRRVATDPTTVASTMVGYVHRVALPAVAITGVLGFALIGMSKTGSFEPFKFSQTWVGFAILLWIVEMLVLWLGVANTEKKVAAGDTEAAKRLPMFTGISHLVLLVILYLMVFKPGAPGLF